MTEGRADPPRPLYALVVESVTSGTAPGERLQPPARYGIERRQTTIGRGAGCSIRLDDMFVSRTHARLLLRDHELYLEDLQSTNETRVNGAPAPTRMRVHPGDILVFGGARCRVEPFGEEGAAEGAEPPSRTEEAAATPEPGDGAGTEAFAPGLAETTESRDRGPDLPARAAPARLFVAGPLPGEPGRTRLRALLAVVVSAVVLAIVFVLFR